jgi:hypothetical protein
MRTADEPCHGELKPENYCAECGAYNPNPEEGDTDGPDSQPKA